MRITDTAEGGDIFTNQVEIASTDPGSDIEAYYDNNIAQYATTVMLPNFEVGKVYESSQVAGTVVTYTLTVTNVGSITGTNIVISDTLPAGLTYGGGDGSFDGTDITWNLVDIAPDGGTATAWFWAALPCTGTITNDSYQVVASDQGIDSPPGDAVTFGILPPTIAADFTQSADAILEGEQVVFTATATTNGTALTYAWDFGDGDTGSGATVAHTYMLAGNYDVSLTATDTCGYSDVHLVPDAVIVSRTEFLIYLPLIIR